VPKETINERRKGQARTRSGRRRRYPRLFSEYDGFYESPERATIAPGGDLNLRGAFLRTPVPDNPGTEAVIRLALPGSPTLLKIDAQVVHANDDPEVGPVGMGLRFMGLLPWQLKRIAALLLAQGGLEGLRGTEVVLSRERRCPCMP